jgi:hypothetical protein
VILRDLRTAAREWSAHRVLRRLMDTVGRPGLRSAAREPGLAALLDQHAAAVRDIVRDPHPSGRGQVATLAPTRTASTCIKLAAYARSLQEEQRRSGASITMQQDGTWRPTDWTTLRLIAICQVSGL